MVRDYLKMFANDLGTYSDSLLKKSILIEKPWTLIDEDGDHQTLIFKKDKSLILSKNGQAQIGSWDYFSQAKSLLIDRVTDKILCTEAYIDDAVMILKMGSKNEKYFSLANENLLPDLDVLKYLSNLRNRKNNFFSFDLNNGKRIIILKQQQSKDLFSLPIGSKVVYDITDEEVEDGLFKLKSYHNIQVKIIDSKILFSYFERVLERKGEIDLLVLHQKHDYNFRIGDLILINKSNDYLEDGEYFIYKNLKVHIIKGEIVKRFKRFSFLWFSFGDFFEY